MIRQVSMAGCLPQPDVPSTGSSAFITAATSGLHWAHVSDDSLLSHFSDAHCHCPALSAVSVCPPVSSGTAVAATGAKSGIFPGSGV